MAEFIQVREECTVDKLTNIGPDWLTSEDEDEEEGSEDDGFDNNDLVDRLDALEVADAYRERSNVLYSDRIESDIESDIE